MESNAVHYKINSFAAEKKLHIVNFKIMYNFWCRGKIVDNSKILKSG
jgi:hypothetical protein